MNDYFNKTTYTIDSEKFVEDLMCFLEHINSKEKIVEDSCHGLKSMESIVDSMPILMKTAKKQADFILPLESMVRAANEVAEAEIILKRLDDFIKSEKQNEMFKYIDSIRRKTIAFNYLLLPRTSKNRRKRQRILKIGD